MKLCTIDSKKVDNKTVESETFDSETVDKLTGCRDENFPLGNNNSFEDVQDIGEEEDKVKLWRVKPLPRMNLVLQKITWGLRERNPNVKIVLFYGPRTKLLRLTQKSK